MTKSKEPKTVAMVGFSPTSRHMAPWEDESVEIWGLNEAYVQPWMKRWDRWFQMHSRANFSRPDNISDPGHWEWLQKDHGKPIYMQHKYSDVPNAVAFPLEKSIEVFGRYFDSTIAYMLALAYLEGFTRIEMYGFEMKSDTEYFYQRANAEFMIGLVMGKGVDVYLPSICNLLKSPSGIYGYEKINVGYRQHLELRNAMCMRQYNAEKENGLKMQGRLELLQEIISNNEEGKVTDIAPMYDKLLVDIQNQASFVYGLKGAMMESKTQIELYDQYPFEEDRGDYEEFRHPNLDRKLPTKRKATNES